MQSVEYFNGQLERNRELVTESRGKKSTGRNDFEIVKQLNKANHVFNEMYDMIADEFNLTNGQVRELGSNDFLLKHKTLHMNIAAKTKKK